MEETNEMLTHIEETTNAEVQAAVDKLLAEITNNFSQMSAEIISKRMSTPLPTTDTKY